MNLIFDPFSVAILVGLIFIVTEVVVMQMTTFWFLYVGIGALLTALVLKFVPDLGWFHATGLFIVATLLVTVLINRPLRRWQQKPAPISGNDAVGQRVEVTEKITPQQPGKVNWSGSDWDAELAEGETGEIEAGTRATIVSMHGITLVVR